MTNHINEQTIAAFIDGEPVAAEPLREALALPEGREYLIDLVALRGLIISDSMEQRPRPQVFPRREEVPGGRSLWWRRSFWRCLAGDFAGDADGT